MNIYDLFISKQLLSFILSVFRMPRKKEYQIDEVVDKAMHTFWNNGYENATVRMLEKDMGINQFSIYSSFGNKHNLFIEVLKTYKNHVEATFLKELLRSEGHVEDIRQFLLKFGHAVQSGKNANGCLMVNTGIEIGKKDVQISEHLTRYFNFIKDTFSSTLEKAKERKELASDFDCRVHAEFLLGSLQGLSLYAKFRSEVEIDDFVGSIMKVIH